MISHKHKCIFVHVPKAAGTSIERVFLEDLDLDMDNRHSLLLGQNNNNRLGPRRVSHLFASDYVNHHYISRELYDSYYKFSFVRNPFTRLFSTYKFLGYDELYSFDEFIQKKLRLLLNNPKFDFFLKPSYDYLFDTDGNCLVDFIGKFESLNDDFIKITNKIDFYKSDTKLKHYNKTNFSNRNLVKRTYGKVIKFLLSKNSDYKISDLSREIVLEIYNKDFENFGYLSSGE